MTFRGFCFNNTTCHTCVRAQELSQHWERRSCDSSLCIFFNQVHLFSATIESEALTWPTNYEMKLFPLLWPEEGCVYNSISSLAVTGSIGGWKKTPVIKKGGKKENQRSRKCAFLMKNRCPFISLLQQRVKVVNKISKNLRESKTSRTLRPVGYNELHRLEGEVKNIDIEIKR